MRSVSIAMVVLSFGLGAVNAQTVIYVVDDAPLGGNGTSWPTAFRCLQDALHAAGTGDEVRVAQGIYRPDQDEAGTFADGNRYATFQLINGVGIHGGYAGLTHPHNPDHREIGVLRSVLTGDLIGDDDPLDFPGGSSNLDNAHHVVTGSGTDDTAVLDGFTITAGNGSTGGGMYNYGGSPTVANCVFIENSAFVDGGGMYNSSGSPTVTNCIFRANWAGDYGGAMYSSNSAPTITNCTINGNASTNVGGGVHNYDSTPTVTNCVLWGNRPNQYHGRAAISYSDVEGGWEGVGNIDADPVFADAPDGNFRLRSGSPCIDAGDNSAVPVGVTTDLDGQSRQVDDPCASDTGSGTAPVVDMGAFEFHTPPRCGDGLCEAGESCELCVCDCGECCGDGVCAAHEHCLSCAVDCTCPTLHVPSDYGLIQEAIEAARDGDEIIVGPGTYYEAIDLLGKAIVVRSSDGPGVTSIDATGLDTSVVSCWNGEGPETLVRGFTITGGNSARGGGMYIWFSAPSVANCMFSGNIASNSGGGMYTVRGNPKVTNCTFAENVADRGGGMDNSNSDPTMVNCVFIDNVADSTGGGLANSDSSPRMTNCTFTGNTARSFGGGISNAGGISTPTVNNCILWSNHPDQITNSPIVSYSNIEGGWEGTGNIDADPLFADPYGGDVRLRSGSPCIDAGNNAVVPEGITTDLDDNTRMSDDLCADDVGSGTSPLVDMGAFEFQTPPGCGDGVCDVSESCDNCACDCGGCCGNGVCAVHEDCLSCAADCSCRTLHVPGDYGLIQEAIQATRDGDEILVGPGVYYEAIDFLGKAIALRGSCGSGGTTIDATGLNASVVTCRSRERPDTVLEGFTITGGTALGGGGMYNSSSHPTVMNCTFHQNSAYGSGGGMYNSNSSPTVTNCQFSGNTAETGGGGMYNQLYSSPTVTNCSFIDNTVTSSGGGMRSHFLCSPRVTNCTFSKNKAQRGGGGMHNYYSNPTVTNCTFSGNITGTYRDGGGLYNTNNSTPTMANCILWHNQPDQIAQTDSTTTISYSDIEGGWEGVGNIDVDPFFLDAFRGDLRLRSGSPCIDAGDSLAVPAGITTDLDGQVRLIDDPSADDTGSGVPPIVDMGAFELPAPPWCGDGVCEDDESCELCFSDCGYCCGDGVCAAHEDCLSCPVDCACLSLRVPVEFGLIQEAIEAARHGDQIIVGPGTYYEAIDLLGKTIAVRSSDGPSATTIDATGLDTSVVTCQWNEGPDTLVDGFTITGGNSHEGGGMYTDYYTSPTVINCIFSKNTARYGGGMYNSGSTPTVVDCVFTANTASDIGGGMCNRTYADVTVINCAFIGNATRSGAGVYNYDSNLTATNCTFSQNSASGVGGGGIFNFRSSATVAHSILWGNSPNQIHGSATVSYSDIEGTWEGVGNIADDPLFAPGPSGCFYLSQVDAGDSVDSPCFDAGGETAVHLGLDALTTRNDEGTDTGPVDMGYHHQITGNPLVMGDFDRNQRDDLSDFVEWEPCMGGPRDVTVSPCCRIFDFEFDGDVDLKDFALFQGAFTAPR